MQSAKKRAKVLSALSIAAGATMITQVASAATLTMYYDNVGIVDNTYSYPGPVIGSDSTGDTGTGNVVATPTIQQGVVNTITMSVGQVLEFGINAILTSNTNPDGGKKTGGFSTAQPSNLGLAQLGIRIPSTDGTGATLLPLTDGSGPQGNYPGVGGQPYYNSTALVNSTVNGAGTGAGGGSSGVPQWQGAGPGDTSPTQPGQGGQVGIGFQIVGGNVSLNGTDDKGKNAVSLNTLQYFAGATASNAASTDFFDSLAYQAGKAGVVTLSPAADSTATTYWGLATPGGTTTASPSIYQTNFFSNSGDVLTPLPVLVIDIVGGSSTVTPPASHPLFSLTSSAPASNYGNQLTNSATPGADQGTFTGPGAASNALTVVGAGGSYKVAAATGINGGTGDATNYVEANGFNPGTDAEIYALDVEVGGQQASPTQLNTLIAEAGSIGGLPAGLSLSTVDPSPNPFGSNYNLFVNVAGGDGFATDFLGFDLSNANDSNLSGYTVSAVAVVPEPMSLGLLALGGMGLMSRRNRRNKKA